MALLNSAVCAAIVTIVLAVAPEKMRVVKVRGLKGCNAPDFSCLGVEIVDTPKPAKGHALVKLNASSVNPSDVDIVEMPIVSAFGALGDDFSGVIVECRGCSLLKVGDRVWGAAGFNGGAFGDYMSIAEAQLSLAPTSLDLTAAGTIPAVALTSYFSLKELGAPWKGENTTVVITSGSGGTGFMGIQLAKIWGASHIVTACSPHHMDFVRSLGADIIVDYHKQSLWDYLPNNSVDFVYDNYGEDGTADKASAAIRPGGKYLMMPHAECFVYATLGLPQAQKPPCTARYPKDGVAYENFNTIAKFAKGGKNALDEIKGMFNNGKLVAHVDKVFTRNEIREAYNYSKSGHIVGKIAVVPAPPSKSDKCAAALECTTDRSVILPVDGSISSKYPCYEGSPADINHACNLDILRRPFPKIVKCGTCAESGYGRHLFPDPLFRKVDLWLKGTTLIV